MICTIYKITNIKNGKVYIGQTWKTTAIRAGQDGSRYVGCKRFYNAIKYHGWENFKTEIVCYAVSQSEADYWEEHFMRKYDSLNRSKGYNIKEKAANGKGDLSAIARENISNSQKGKKLSPEHRAKISKRLKGGKLTEEHKAKISASHIGITQTEEAKKKISIANSGREVSEETRKKLSEAHSGENNYFFGKTHTEDTKEKISKARMGQKPSEETRAKLSEAGKGRKVSKETRKKKSEAIMGEKHPMFGKHFSGEVRANMSKARKNRSPEVEAEIQKRRSEKMTGRKRVIIDGKIRYIKPTT